MRSSRLLTTVTERTGHPSVEVLTPEDWSADEHGRGRGLDPEEAEELGRALLLAAAMARRPVATTARVEMRDVRPGDPL